MMTSRQLRILNEIALNTLTVDDLSDLFEVSVRTINNDVNDINHFLKEFDMQIINSINNTYLLNGDIDFINERIISLNYYDFKLDQFDRLAVIFLLLIIHNNEITIEQILNFLQVSRTTVINDVEKLNMIIARNNLEIVGLQSVGLKVNGQESNIRKELTFIIKNQMMIVRQFLNQNEIKSILTFYSISDDLIYLVIKKAEKEADIKLDMFEFENINLYLVFVIIRISNGNVIKDINHNLKPNTESFVNILNSELSEFNLNIPYHELVFLQQLFMRDNRNNNELNDILHIQFMTNQLIKNVSNDICIDLSYDYSLWKDLSIHIANKSGVKLTMADTHELDILIKNYPTLEQSVSDNIKELERFSFKKITTIEKSLITLYFIVSINKKISLLSDVQILVICETGNVTSRLLEETLLTKFKGIKVFTITRSEYDNSIHNDYDLVISSGIEDRYDGVLQLSSFLSDKSIDRIEKEINNIRMNKLMDSNQNEDAYIEQPGSKINKNSLSLSKLINTNLIRFENSVSSWQEAVKISGSLLLEEGYVERGYINAMISNININGPYIVISEGVAIPHAGSDDGVYKTGISCLVLKNPIRFGVDDLDPIYLIFSISTVDSHSHLRGLFDLVNILENEEQKKELMSVKNEDDLMEVIKKYEK